MSEDQSDLEKEFKNLVSEKSDLIEAKLRQADKLIEEAVSISEEFGIPFDSRVCQIGQSYFPKSFHKKFGGLDLDMVANVTGAWTEDPEYGGWNHSAVC